MEVSMILIKNGQLVDPKSRRNECTDILIKDGKILAIRPVTEEEEAVCETVIDAEGFIVAPGFVDTHVHFRDPGFTYKEDIHTGAEAAKRGGFTTVVCMANTNPVVDNPETLDYVLSEGKKTGIHVLSAASITKGMKGEELTDFKTLKEHGAVVFTDDGMPIMDETLLIKAMKLAKELDVPLSFHEEDKNIITNNGINEGRTASILGVTGSPSTAEELLIARDCLLAGYIGTRICIQHISTKGGVQNVRIARAQGVDVVAEATPHHFSLTEEALLEYKTLAKMNPPLRTDSDRREIIGGLIDNTISIIATDHAPHSKEEKEKPLTEAPSGIIGLETSLALGMTYLVNKSLLSLTDFIARMSYQPAKFYGLNAGYIAEGGPADLVLFHPTELWTVDNFRSKSSNSPFLGQTLQGRVRCTICDGKIVYQDI